MQSCVFTYSLEVQNAINRNGPVVVLESTAIAQGLPWPDNLETAQAMEAVIRNQGAFAATIAIFDGVARIGLSAAELEQVARSATCAARDDSSDNWMHQDLPHRRFDKANRRDLGAAIARRSFASTTVSATLWLARRCGLN